MSDFSKSIVYSGLVLVAGLIAVFAISSNMTTTDDAAAPFAVIEPAAGDEATEATDTTTEETSATETGITDEDLAELRKVLEAAGVNISETEPAAGDETTGDATVNTAPTEE